MPRRQLALHPIARHLRQPQTRQRGAGVELGAAHADDGTRAHQHVASVHHKVQRQRATGGAGHVIDGPVGLQVFQRGGHAMARQVCGAGHRHLRHLCDLPARQRGVLQHARAQHAVHAFPHQIHQTVVLAQVQHDVGIALKKIGQAGHDEEPGKRALGIDAQQPFGRSVQESAVGLFQVGQQAHTALVMRLAVMRQAHLARRAFKKTRPQPGLHALDQVGDRGPRNPQVFRCLGKTAALRDAHEHLHFLETIHACPANC